MQITRRALLGSAMPLPRRRCWARARRGADIRFGVLTDLSGPYSDIGGPAR